MDARLIGAVTPVDVVGSMARGNELAAQTLQMRDQNALRNVYRTQGAGLLQGNQQSLNALAAIDPAAALGIQNNVLQNQTVQRQFEIMNAQEKRAIAEASARMDEQQRAQAAEAVKREVFKFIAAPSPEVFDQLVTQAGKPELRGQWANRQVLGAEYVSSVEEALKLGAGPEQPEWRPATPEEAAQYGSSAGQINTKTGAFKAFNPPSTMAIRTNPDGSSEIIQGPNAKFTEAQSKDNVFATRARGALAKLEAPIDPNNPQSGAYADALAVLRDDAANRLPVVGNYMTSDNFQVARTAGDEFLQAILRKDTGAAITPDEQTLYGGTYLPQPGDGGPRLKYKAEARARAVAAIEAGMSQAQMEALARADAAVLTQMGGTTPGAPGTPETPASPAEPPAGLTADDLKYLETP